MTISKRNIFFVASNIILILVFIITASVPIVIGQKTDIPYSVIFYSADFLLPLILLLFSIIAIYLIRYSFLITNSSEIFFFVLFLISLVFDVSRSLIAAFSYLKFPEYYMLFISRICYFGRFLGLLSLFLSALFSADVETRKTETATAIIILISYILSSSIPFSTYKLATMIQQPGYFSYFAFSILSIEILTVLIFILNYLQSGNSEYIGLSASMFLIFAGREITFFTSEPVLFISGLIALAAGALFFSGKIHYIYSWY